MKFRNLGLFENESDSTPEDALALSIQEWRALKKQLALVSEIAGVIGGRISELEVDMQQIMEDTAKTQQTVDGAVITISSRKSTSVKYKEVVDKALEISNSKIRAYLESFIKDVATNSSVKQVLAIKDPEMAHVMSDVTRADPAELVKMVKKLRTLPQRKSKNKVEESIAQSIKELFSKLHAHLLSLFKRAADMVRSAESLEKAANRQI